MESAEIIAAINNQTIITIVSILGITFVVGGAAIAWLRSDIKRVENKSETAHEEIRGRLCDIRETLAKLTTDVDWLKPLLNQVSRHLITHDGTVDKEGLTAL